MQSAARRIAGNEVTVWVSTQAVLLRAKQTGT